MCYQVEVLEYNEDKAIITVGESKFIAYHDTDVSVEKTYDYDERYTGKFVDAMTNLGGLHVVVHEDGDEMLDIQITATLDKTLVKAIEHTIALAAINEKEQELENAANSFDWSVGHVSHYYI